MAKNQHNGKMGGGDTVIRDFLPSVMSRLLLFSQAGIFRTDKLSYPRNIL